MTSQATKTTAATGSINATSDPTQLDEERHEDGREDRPLGQRAGNDEVEHDDYQDEADQQRDRRDAGLSQPSGQRGGDDAGQVGVVEVGDELADHQQHEDQTAQAGKGLDHCGDYVVGALVLADRGAEGNARDAGFA